ncbi:hypothetical protein PIB30_093520 [Stylosanthes scabra]|uniref:Uncharacterized protein n=1 Tax=Stylosanthes scabra TaxID=79078 RepID=A0ABU6WTG1_9FABA|nr:hypothetical protein [Stylosanthes scabra]
MQFLQQSFYENMQKSQADYMEEVKQIKAKQEEMWNNTNRFQSKIKKSKKCLLEYLDKGSIHLLGSSAANPNLSEIPITQIPDLMQTNAEKGRPMFFGCLKSDYGASSSSKTDQQELVPLRTAPPIPGYQPPHHPPN